MSDLEFADNAGRRRSRAAFVRWLPALALLPLVACAQDARPTRVVLITLDTLRYDGFAGEGGEQRMPALHALADRGQTFERNYASTSTTQPTHASLFTGLHPWAHGVTRNGLVLADERTTLAERLRANGFETHAVVASFPLHEQFGFAQGFDTYVDDFDVPYARKWEGKMTEQGTFFSLATSITRDAQLALDGATGERQFFWFHYFDPHDPYGDSAGGDPMHLPDLITLAAKHDPALTTELERARARYDADLAALDRSLATLFARLAADEDQFETHIVVTADHGESFGEHMSIGHGKRVTPEQVHVPLVITSPRATPAVRRDAVTSVDLARTLLALTGVDATGFHGRDLLAPGADSDDATVFGMRRTFDEPRPERLSDGRVRPLAPHWFFAVRGDELFAGDATTVLRDDALDRELDGPSGAEWRGQFAAFTALLEAGGDAEALVDEETLEALRLLGYVE